MINEILKWIDNTVVQYIPTATKCSELAPYLKGCYSNEFLENSYFVITNDIPKPQFTSDDPNLNLFIDMDFDGITYKNIYFVKPHVANDFAIHVHELVHVAQWSILGAQGFIERYIGEVSCKEYRGAPLEMMAYEIDQRFRTSKESFDILSIVEQRLKGH